MGDFERARWYEARPSANRKPVTYHCPLCHGRLLALEPHLLVLPEGDPARRRHAHTACVRAARAARAGGSLPLREDVEPPRRGLLARLLRR